MSLYDDASLIMFPSGYKEDKIYSLKPTDGSGDLTFTRASTATRVNSDGLIETSPVNLLLNTDTLSSWSLEGGTLTSGQTDPNGGSTAFKYVQITGGIYSGGSSETSGSKTATIWLKSVSGTSMACNVNDGNAGNVTVVNVTGDWQLFTVAYTTPTSRPSLYIYSISNAAGIYIWHPQLNTGSTAKPYFPTTDRLNVPRIDYTGGGCGKLLLEPQRTNVISYSEDFSNAAWTKTNATITANNTTSPDGTTNADKLTEDTSTGTHKVTATAAAPNIYTISVYAKYNGRILQIASTSTAGHYANFDLLNGVIGNFGVTTENVTITEFANGWYRCSMTTTSNMNTAIISTVQSTTSAYQESYLGDGTSGIYIYGAQLELGSYSTSLINTTSTAVTRLADAASKTGISSLINSTEGVLYAEISALANDGTFKVISMSDSSTSNVVRFYKNINENQMSIRVTVAGVHQFNVVYTLPDSTANNKMALKYKANDFAFWVNGVEVVTATSGTTFTAGTLTELAFDDGSGATPFYGNVQSLMIFPSALSDTELATLTTL
jgi:Fe-S cluster assembly iron-binding protein IscA